MLKVKRKLSKKLSTSIGTFGVMGFRTSWVAEIITFVTNFSTIATSDLQHFNRIWALNTTIASKVPVFSKEYKLRKAVFKKSVQVA